MTNKRRFYTKVPVKFAFACFMSALWTGISIYLAEAWVEDLTLLVNHTFAIFAIYGIAIIPGSMNSFILISLLLDKRPVRKHFVEYPDITVLMAAYNEGPNMEGSLATFAEQTYPGKMRVIVCNDGSKDNTAEIVYRLMKKYAWLDICDLKQNVGKSQALNAGLAMVDTAITITVDGDSYLHHDAIKHIVERYMSDPDDTVAIAGSILVRNSHVNWVTRIQEWDYYLGIAAVKRLQSFYHGTMVAQGAFSLYRTDILRKVNGWPHCVGEDIVLTWAFLKMGYRTGFAEDAILFTNAPENLMQFIKQRQRWSRGLIEAFKEHWPLLFKPRMSTIFVWWNLLFPWLDLAYSLVFMPGIVLACFGLFYIVGPMTLVLIPAAFFMNYVIYNIQTRMLKHQGIVKKSNISGAIIYIIAYSMILVPACLWGYVKEVFWGRIKNWGTK